MKLTFCSKDISEEAMVLHEKIFRQATEAEHLRSYYEMDAGKSQAEIDASTEPEEELIFIADDVDCFVKKIKKI